MAIANDIEDLVKNIPPAYWQEPRTINGATSSTATSRRESATRVEPLIKDRTPTQMRTVHVRSSPLLKLEAGWDGHDGKRISQDALRFAWHILENIFIGAPDLNAPQIIPLSYGGIQAEWHTWKGDLEIEVERVQSFRWYFRDRHTGLEEEGEGSADFSILEDLVSKI